MKKIAVIFLIFAMFFLISCGSRSVIEYFPGNYIVGKGQRPTDFPGTKWISTNPDIWFEVPEATDLSLFPYGKINYNDESLSISITFNPGRSIFIYDESTGKGRILTGLCKFRSDKLIVKIDNESFDIFDGVYDTITFYKADEKTD